MCLTAVDASQAQDADPLFADNGMLEARLSAPLSQIMQDRSSRDELPGTFTLTLPDGAILEVPVEVRTRGNYRRQADICEFAPLRLNFKKGEMKDTFLHKQDKLKLVTHCNNKSEVYRQSVIKEFLAYRILNQLTDYSFRARLLRMTYVDTDTDEELEAYAFLIESAERLGKRLGMEPSTLQAVNEMRINQAHTNIGSVFQYMIVNLDFSAVQGSAGKPCCHNYTLFSPDKQAYWSIPYDFDKTGLAEPPHHGPSPEYKQRHVRDRKYRGRCRNNDFLPETMQVFRDGRDAIDALIANQEGLSTASRNRVESLVQSFYKEVDKESRLLRKLQKNCI